MLVMAAPHAAATRLVDVRRAGVVEAGAVLVTARTVIRPRVRGRIVLYVRCGDVRMYVARRARRGFAAVRLAGPLGGCSFRVRATAVMPVGVPGRVGLRVVEFGRS